MAVKIAQRLTLAALLCASLVVRAAPKDVKKSGEVERRIDVRSVEHKSDHRIRIFMSAIEDSAGIKYPISTIERNMVKVEFTNTSTPPAEAKSLSILGSQPGDLRRAMFIAFDLDRNLTGRELSEVRERISEIIAEIPAQYLTVTAMAQGSARVIADVTPDKSDNINRIQQQIAALPAEGDGPALADSLCVAAERFHAWNVDDFKLSDQKVLLIVSPSGDSPSTERYRAENCWRSLLEQKVRVFHISFGKSDHRAAFDLSSVAHESSGFVHVVSGPLDILAATKNFIALLKNEYFLDVDAPDISLEDQPLELQVKVAYHDATITSEVYNVGFVIPTLSQVFASSVSSSSGEASINVQDDIERAQKQQFVIVVCLVLILLAGFFFALRQLKKRLRSTSCNTCGARVRKDHADCPFRKPETVARLVMVTGPYAGMTYPVVRGPNRISFLSNSGIVLPRGKVRWFNHGTIVADGFKVAYTPRKPGKDRLNGWPITETRLMGQGYVLRIGHHHLRLEIKPSMASMQ